MYVALYKFVVFSTSLDCGSTKNGAAWASIKCSIPYSGFAGVFSSVSLGQNSCVGSLNISLIALSKDQVSDWFGACVRWRLCHGPSRLGCCRNFCNLRRLSSSFISTITIIIHRMNRIGWRRKWRWTLSSSLVWVFGSLWSFASPMRSWRGQSRRGGRRRS